MNQSLFAERFVSYVQFKLKNRDKVFEDAFERCGVTALKCDTVRNPPFLIEIPFLAEKLVNNFNSFYDTHLTRFQFAAYMFDVLSNYQYFLPKGLRNQLRAPFSLENYKGDWECFGYLHPSTELFDLHPTHETHVMNPLTIANTFDLPDYNLSLPRRDRARFVLREHHEIFGRSFDVNLSAETLNYTNNRLNVGFTGALLGNYLIINWDESYQWVVVGDFSLNHLVFLTRSTPTRDDLREMFRSASAFGYTDFSRMMFTRDRFTVKTYYTYEQGRKYVTDDIVDAVMNYVQPTFEKMERHIAPIQREYSSLEVTDETPGYNRNDGKPYPPDRKKKPRRKRPYIPTDINPSIIETAERNRYNYDPRVFPKGRKGRRRWIDGANGLKFRE